MIKRIQKIKPKPGKIMESRQYAQEFVNFFKTKYPEIPVEVYFEVFVDAQALHFIFQYESLSDMENKTQQVVADQEFMAFYNKGNELFVEGYNKVTIIRSF
jgi:hypothetical protein